MRFLKLLFFILILVIAGCMQETHATTQITVETSTDNQSPIPTVIPTSTKSPTKTPIQTPTSVSKFWHGTFFSNATFTAPVVFERFDETISFDWRETSQAPDLPTENFSATWQKCTEFEEKYYTFLVNNSIDSTVTVLLNDLLVLDSREDETEQKSIDFFTPGGNNCLTVKLSHTSGPAFIDFDFYPSETTFPQKAGKSWDWKAKYYPNPTFTEPFAFERIDDEISFDWGDTNPAPNIPRDNFSIIWEKCTDIEFREYTFTFQTNENVRLDIIFNNIWILESRFEDIEEITDTFLGPAGDHCVTVKLVHESGDALVNFSFE